LGDGHYWEKDGLVVKLPVRFVGDEQNPANVVVEMAGGTLSWNARGGWVEGVTFRRPRMASGETASSPLLALNSDGRLDIIQSVFDSQGNAGNVVDLRGSGIKGNWDGVVVKGGDVGIVIAGQASLHLKKVRFHLTTKMKPNRERKRFPNAFPSYM